MNYSLHRIIPSHGFFRRAFGLVGLGVFAGAVLAQPITVPNHSFESPDATGFPAVPFFTDWQKNPQPVWFDPEDFDGFAWNNMSGVFPEAPSYIENPDGDQVAYFFTLPEVGVTQLLSETFQAGLSYDLTVSIRGGGGITDGALFRIGLYYLDGGTPVSIDSTTITYSAANFPNPSQLVDHTLTLAPVQVGDAWAGQNIGIELQSMNFAGIGPSYWELDNVRLTVVPEPSTFALMAAGLGGGWWFMRRRRSAGK